MINKKYFFFDIDGTLRTKDTHEIPQSTKDAIKALQDAGHFVAIATGRALFSARMMARKVGVENVVSDGGRVAFYEGQVIYKDPIPKEDVEACYQQALKHDIPIGFCDEFAVHSESDFFLDQFMMDETIICNVKKCIEYNELDSIQKVYLNLSKSDCHLMPITEKLEHHYFKDNLCIIEYRAKEDGIQAMLSYLDASMEDVVVFGDDINDISMFKAAKTSVAMGNATDSLKEVASFVTRDINEDGILYACKKHGWISLKV